MLDIANPFGFISDLFKAGKLQRWYTIIVGGMLAAFIGFWSAFGLTGAAMLSAGYTPVTAIVAALFSGALIMAASVLTTLKAQGAWKDLRIMLPANLQKIVEASDMATSNGETVK